MKPLNDIIRAMESCTDPDGIQCQVCPYNGERDCQTEMDRDALEVLKKHRVLRSLIAAKKTER